MAYRKHNLTDEIEASARSGDREQAYQLARVALINNIDDSSAWVWMARLVDDPTRRRECVDRALALDPQNKAALGEQSRLQLATLLQQAPHTARHSTTLRIGDYLVEQKLITIDQRDEALIEQRRLRSHGDLIPIGDLLLRRGWISPRNLARALVRMHQVQLALPGATPHMLGEHLLAQAAITPLQLEEALEEQILLNLEEKHLPLGYILVRRGYLSPAALDRAIAYQRAQTTSEIFA